MPQIDPGRLERDRSYLEELALALLNGSAQDTDHTELRRTALRVFPELSSSRHAQQLSAIVGHAATIRARQSELAERDVTDLRLAMTATEPLAYPPSYADLDEATRGTVVRFCEEALARGKDGPEALAELLRLHGWPYNERTFYVGPWKAARLRSRRRDQAS